MEDELAVPDATEHVSLDYNAGHFDSNLGVDDLVTGPCACGDDYSCLGAWADENFRCGVCVSLTCSDHGADICTDPCTERPPAAQTPGYQFSR